MLNTGPELKVEAATQVAVAVIENTQGQVLVSQRSPKAHLGGYWEFPGGKLEQGESVESALKREIKEELGLHITSAKPLLQIPWQYPGKPVLLHVWRVLAFEGEPVAREGQPWQWVSVDALSDYRLPPANRSILTAWKLPERVLVTGQFQDTQACIQKVQHAVETHGIRCVQFRAPWLNTSEYQHAALQLLEYCRSADVALLLNGEPDILFEGVAGLHLPSGLFSRFKSRPVAQDVLLGASCHSQSELQAALSLQVDYVSISPVCATQSHPEVSPLGWSGLAALAAQCPVPVMGLGGLCDEDMSRIKRCGAYGIAAISTWW